MRLDFAREFLEYEVLILHLGAEARRLKQTLAVPGAVGKLPLGDEGGIVAGEDDALDVLDEAVVLGVEDEVDRGQPDVLVAPAVACDKVDIEQLVVVARRLRQEAEAVWNRAGDGIVIGHETRVGSGSVRDVIEGERVAGAASDGPAGQRGQIEAAGDTLDQTQVGHELREAVRAGDEAPICIGREQRNVEDVRVGQLDSEVLGGLRLDLGPVANAPLAPSINRPVATVRPSPSEAYSRRNT